MAGKDDITARAESDLDTDRELLGKALERLHEALGEPHDGAITMEIELDFRALAQAVEKAGATIMDLEARIRQIREALTSCAGCWTAPDCDDCPIPALLRSIGRGKRGMQHAEPERGR